MGGSSAQTGRQRGKGVEVPAQDVVDADTIVFGAVQRQLECTEEPGGSFDGGRDKPEFTENSLELLVGDSVGVGQVCEDLGELELAVGRQLDSLPDRVDDPPQCDLACGPTAVTFEDFLEGHGFVSIVARRGLG